MNPNEVQQQNSSVVIPPASHKKSIFGVITALIILAVLGGAYYFYFGAMAYTIPNVPYSGIYNHKGELSRIDNSSSAAVYSLVEYWAPGPESVNTAVALSNNKTQATTASPNTLAKLASYFSSLPGYSATVKDLPLSQFSDYINSKMRTPLVVFLPIKKELLLPMPVRFASVVIGIDMPKKKLIMHHYWYGNNYEVSFEDFYNLIGITEGENVPVLIVQSNNLPQSLALIKERPEQPYSPRTEVMEKARPMFEEYATGLNLMLGNLEAAKLLPYLFAVVNNPNFEAYFPPYFQVDTYDMIALQYYRLNDLTKAEEYINKALEKNHDLNQPKGSWPGFDGLKRSSGNEGRLAVTYRVLGYIKIAQKDYKAGLAAHEEAYKIYPDISTSDLAFLKKLREQYGAKK